MLRKLQTYILLIFASVTTLALWSCSDAIDTPDENLVAGVPGTLTIRFTNTSLTRNALSDNSENFINNLVVGLYRDIPSDEIEPSKFIVLEDVNKFSSHEFTVALTDALVTELFNNTGGSECRIFAVANLPSGTFTAYDRPTIAQLKSIPIEANFYTQDVQSSFVMAGEGTVTYTAPTAGRKIGSAMGGVSMLRAAAKIRLNVALPDTIHVGQKSPADTNYEIWRPVPSYGIFSLLNCGVQKSVSAPISVLDTSGDTQTLIPWKPTDKSAYYNSTLLDGSWRELKNSGTGEYSYLMDVPFYTFPNAWVESPEEDFKTTLTLTVAWQREGQLSWHTFFYQIPITPASMPRIVRNHSYTINLKVGMLGALTQEEPVKLEDLSYQIVDWGSEDVNVDLQDFRYLVVDPNVINVNNEEEVTIPFYSSHPVDIENLTMTFQRFNYYSNGNGDVVKVEVPQDVLNASTWTHQIEENGVTKTVTDTICTVHTVRDPKTNQWMLKIKHPLTIWVPYNSSNQEVKMTGQAGSGEKTITAASRGITRFRHPDNPETPYSSYVFKFKLCHADNPKYEQEIEITQYPGMYIQADRNTGGVYNTGYERTQLGTRPNRYYKYTPTTSDYGFVFVNPTLTDVPDNATGNPNPQPFSYWTNDAGLGGVHGVSGTNSNPNMYVITISQLDFNSKYVIGDPRSNYINNDLTGSVALIPTANQITAAGDWCEEATAFYSNPSSSAKRRLLYYYPTNEVPLSNVNAYRIAPKLRIASSYGKTTKVSRENARRRAATYQERAYPAGRWRLPTMGEIEFITSLSSTGKIPELFTTGSTYWSAQGPCTVNSDGTITLETDHTSTYFIRPVYDDWYWEQYPQYSLNPAATSFSYTLGDVPRGVQ